MWGNIVHTKNGYGVRGYIQGKRKYFGLIPWYGGFLKCESKAMAIELQREISSELRRGVFNELRYRKSKPLHIEGYARNWLDIKEDEIAYNTWKSYRSAINRYIVPLWGNEYIPDLTKDKIRVGLNSLDVELSYKKQIHICLRTMLHDALDSGYINQMPVAIKFRLPVKKREWIDGKIQAVIIKNITPTDRYIFKFMFATGIRPGEARALRKADVKRDNITIRSTFAPVAGGERLKSVKQRKERVIPMYESVRQLFKEMPGNLTPWVFLYSKTGRPYNKNFAEALWKPACRKAGEKIKLYNATRHSFANQMLKAGADFALVSQALGHANVAVTKKHYGEPHLNIMKQVVDNVQGMGG